MKSYYLLLLCLALGLTACGDDDIDAPDCIQGISDNFAPDACRGSGDLTIWTFDGEDVYCFNQGTCFQDGVAEIYDADCRQLCILGGASGNTICQGLEWSTNAVLRETLLRY